VDAVDLFGRQREDLLELADSGFFVVEVGGD
jgi:hypothetical protein